MDQKVINGHKDPVDSHNYHDENHDEIEFYLGNSDRSTWWHSTLEQRTPKNQSDWLSYSDCKTTKNEYGEQSSRRTTGYHCSYRQPNNEKNRGIYGLVINCISYRFM